MVRTFYLTRNAEKKKSRVHAEGRSGSKTLLSTSAPRRDPARPAGCRCAWPKSSWPPSMFPGGGFGWKWKVLVEISRSKMQDLGILYPRRQRWLPRTRHRRGDFARDVGSVA